MKNCLVMLTKTFPFDTGEEFIENELPITAKSFEKVILIATSTAGHAIQTRPVPANTAVCRLRASAVLRYVKPKMAKNFFVLPKAYQNPRERADLHHSPERRLYFAYLLAKGTAVTEQAAALLKKWDLSQYDAVTFYSYWFYDTAFAALKLKQACKIPHCAAYSRAHSYDLYLSRNKTHYLPLRPYLLENLDHVFPCSNNGSQYLKTAYPDFAGKVSTAYLGTKDYGTGPAASEKQFHLVSCCHLTPIKRVHLLAQALSLLSGSGLNLKWTHCGGGEGLEDLKKYAEENLSFMECEFPGEKKNQQLMQFYQTHHVDLFVNTSEMEGLPVSIMEACSFGIPIVATDVGGTNEIVRNGQNGFLMDANFTEQFLADKIKLICQMPRAEKEKMRAASRTIWEHHFSADRNYHQFAERINHPGF